MKKIIIAALFSCLGLTVAEARSRKNYDYGTGSNTQTEHVEGYSRRDGTYVQPYERTKANDTLDDNYGTRGNQNPYTGKTGRGNTDADQQQENNYGTYRR